MFDWGELKHRVLESERFCIGGLPINTFFIPTQPYHIYMYKKFLVANSGIYMFIEF